MSWPRSAARRSGTACSVPREWRPTLGLDVEAAVAGPVSAKWTRTCQDPAAVLRSRLQRWQRATGRGPRPQVDMVAVIVPRAGETSTART